MAEGKKKGMKTIQKGDHLNNVGVLQQRYVSYAATLKALRESYPNEKAYKDNFLEALYKTSKVINEIESKANDQREKLGEKPSKTDPEYDRIMESINSSLIEESNQQKQE